MLRMALSAASFVLPFLLGPAAHAADDRSLDLSNVTLTVGTPNKTGLQRELIASGEDQNTPYKIKWAVFDSTPPLTEALRAGRVDIGGGGDTGVLFAIAHGAKIAILGATRYGAPSGSSILVPNDSPLKTVADLKGRKIALPHFTAQHYQLAMALQKAGVPWDDKLILNLNTSDGLSALNNGQVDAFVVWDPNAAIAQTQYAARVLAPLDEAVTTAGMLYTPAQDLTDPAKKAALQDLTRRIIRANAWVDTHPDEWTEQMSRMAQIPVAAARLTVSRAHLHYEPADTPDIIEAWQKEIVYFRSIKVFDSDFQIKDYIAPDFVGVVQSETQKLAAGQ
jgi:sulfonate transport system substrate-binding protein